MRLTQEKNLKNYKRTVKRFGRWNKHRGAQVARGALIMLITRTGTKVVHNSGDSRNIQMLVYNIVNVKLTF